MTRKNFNRLNAVILSAALLTSCGSQTPEPLTVDWRGGLKLDSLCGNPLLDFLYTADPTAVEYDDRLYVYGTNDQQQCDETHPDSANTYV